MPPVEKLFEGYPYLALLIAVLTLAYYARKYDVFHPLYSFIAKNVRSKRAVVALVSAISGVLPIEGRVTVSAGVLSTMAPQDDRRKKYGVLDYLATHHFYFWSPLEKTVLVPMAALGVSYGTFLGAIWPMLATMVIATLFYIFRVLKEEDVDIELRPTREVQTVNVRKYVRQSAETVVLVAVVLLVAAVVKHYSAEFEALVAGAQTTGWTIAVVAALVVGAFAMGSSGKYAGLLAVALPVYGVTYLPLLFTAAWAGYMLSPMHKCMLIGQRMFGSKFSEYYRVTGFVVGLTLLVSVVMTVSQL